MTLNSPVDDKSGPKHSSGMGNNHGFLCFHAICQRQKESNTFQVVYCRFPTLHVKGALVCLPTGDHFFMNEAPFRASACVFQTF